VAIKENIAIPDDNMFHVKHKISDFCIIGAGHAGIEAAWTAANMGCSVVIITMDTNAVGRMSCNPAIGGTAKGHIVKEIDAMGGLMGRIADETGIQFRILNRSKGPAIWSPRSQNDRELYSNVAKEILLSHPSIEMVQGTVESLLLKANKISGVVLDSGEEIMCRAVLISSGTFLNSIMFTGLKSTEGGRFGENSAKGLSKFLMEHGFVTGRLKTGTPPRLDRNTINFTNLDEQPGDEHPVPFSMFSNGGFPKLKQISCFLTYTNQLTHDILRTGFDQSPMFTGKIKGVGPRYCPSIEDKVFRFTDKPRHQVFLEPEGLDSEIIYMNGFSSSLPMEIQQRSVKTVNGLENVKIIRPGYAVEYDFFPTHQTKLTLETKLIEGLYVAGQVNGTSGYEEAAAQGLMAGINAALKIQGKEPFILKRSEAYIGVLIDDLINKNPDEPYRIFTSCAEYRLILRQDNADLRLVKFGHQLGLIPGDINGHILLKKIMITEGIDFLKSNYIPPNSVNEFLRIHNSSEIQHPESCAQFIKRNELSINDFLELDFFKENDLVSRIKSNAEVLNQIDIELKYEGYIKRQKEQAENFAESESVEIPENFDFKKIRSLSTEAREKLNRIKPRSLGQASRIAGVSPSDVSILTVYMRV
jgi:tRNA uridine 5-carboxymethylaminomethyl modification enzyme